MKSIQGIKRIYQGDLYISISIDEAIKATKNNIPMEQFSNLKSLFVKEEDYKKLMEL